MICEKIKNIISEFRLGSTKKQIHEKYGDVGLFAVEKFCKQKLEPPSLSRTFNYETYREEDDAIKQDILKKFLNGENEKDIITPYGEYGELIIEKIKELLSVPPL